MKYPGSLAYPVGGMGGERRGDAGLSLGSRRLPRQLTVAAPTAVRGKEWVAASAAEAARRAAATFSGKILAPNEEGKGRDGEGGREGCVAQSQEGGRAMHADSASFRYLLQMRKEAILWPMLCCQ